MKRCLVLGNGPSLKDMPRELLEKYPTFGSNRVYLLDGFTPTYYAAVNPLVVKQFANEINKMDCEKYITEKLSSRIPGSIPLNNVGCNLFSFRPDKYIWEGFTVTYVLLQLAFWKGFDEVGLLGVKHEYTFTGSPNQLLNAKGPDLNHFAPDYFTDGMIWNAPDLERSENAYRIAHQVYSDAGRGIINLTPGTKLEVFPKGDYLSWLE